MNFLNDLNPSYLLVAGCALGIWALVRCGTRGRLRGARQSGDYLEHLHRPTSKWDGAQKDAAAILQRERVELCELARDLTGQIDSKMIVLQQLIAESQRQIDRLETLLGELKEPQAAPSV